MTELRYTLVCDGSSNVALLAILTWLIREQRGALPVQAEWADLRRVRKPPRSLASRIRLAVDLYPCDLLFVHRDAEKTTVADRTTEIRKAVGEALGDAPSPYVCVVPVRMLEAWLLFDEQAIRNAAGNPNGTAHLDLPSGWEHLSNPKAVLYEAIRTASELSGRRLKKLSCPRAALRVVDYVQDFSPLRSLSAFRTLEQDLDEVLRREGWATPASPT